jgi:anthranilate synthase/aminodeoxychorismate synthase-like glutamine amidotransferase
MPDALRVVFLDNVDSFTYNLVDEFARRGAAVEVHRNDRPAAEVVRRAVGGTGTSPGGRQDGTTGPTLVVVSPGPGTPRDAGSCLDVVRGCAGRVPLFGVCLGHQAIVEAFGGRVERAPAILHGKASLVTHRGGPLFDGLPSPVPVGRYHSLCATDVPADLEVTAESDGIVMAVAHRRWAILGVQFHPESILTPQGGRLIANVMRWAVS